MLPRFMTPIRVGIFLGAVTAAVYLVGARRSFGYDAAATFANFVATPNLVDAFAVRDVGRIVLRVLLALIAGAAGLGMLLAPLHGTYTLTVLLVMWFALTGVIRIGAVVKPMGNAALPSNRKTPSARMETTALWAAVASRIRVRIFISGP